MSRCGRRRFAYVSCFGLEYLANFQNPVGGGVEGMIDISLRAKQAAVHGLSLEHCYKFSSIASDMCFRIRW